MLNYPHVLAKAREEIDRVVGLDRMPYFDDESKLPYLKVGIDETLRCRPPIPMVRFLYPIDFLTVANAR